MINYIIEKSEVTEAFEHLHWTGKQSPKFTEDFSHWDD